MSKNTLSLVKLVNALIKIIRNKMAKMVTKMAATLKWLNKKVQFHPKVRKQWLMI